jgi:hypothetical protein
VFGVYDDASSAYAFTIKGSKLFNFNSTTFRSWGGSATALQVAGYGVIYNDGNNNLLIANNSYYNGSNNIYSNNGYATRYYQELSAGNHYFQVASSGTAGGTVTYNTALYIDSSKAVSVNTTTTSWASGGTTYAPLFNVDGGSANTAYFNNTSAASANVTIAGLNYFLSLDSGSVRVADFRVSENSLNITTTNHILLNPSSNVGIGTTSPVARLDVAGNATLVANFNYTSNGTYVRWQNNGTTFGDIGSGASLVNDGSTNDFTIHARSTYNLTFATNFTERARVTNGGQLLVNATGSTYSTFGYNLGVKGTSSQGFISIARSSQALDSQGLVVGLDSSYAYFQVRDNIGMQIATNDTPRVTISSAGLVGIGTTSPSYQLHVSRSASGNPLYVEGGSSGWVIFKRSGKFKN